ncbi:MAG: hypothetical protein MUD11_14980 [Rhodobacteraceae bacterium]|nr:hypothetical protein [Paracoccaceae bacterium]
MGGSLLGYRVYRLRRLIGLCLLLVAAGIGLGLWLIPGGVTALHLVFGVGLFSVLAMAHLAMIVIWPTDAGGPFAYGLGTLVLLAIALPAAAHQMATGTDAGAIMALAIMIGPFVWLLGAPMLGGWMLWLINMALPTKGKRQRVFDLPVDLSRAMVLFALDPDKTRVTSVHGPVGWDGSFEERVTRRMADPQTGALRDCTSVTTLRMLASDATTRSVLATAAAGDGTTVSLVVHQQFDPLPQGTRLTERLDFEGAPGLGRLTAWLTDSEADYVTAELDADAAHPPRAICHLPLDSMGLAMTRFFKWGDPTPGDT